MADWPLWGGGASIDDLATDTANTRGVVLTSGGSNGVKGSYVQVIASTARAYQGLHICVGNSSIGNQSVIDIAIGAAASEQIILADLAWSQQTVANRDPASSWTIPIYVPASVRVSARTAYASASRTCDLQVHGITGGPRVPAGYGRATTYGITSPKGVTIDNSAGSANTKGSYTEITSATSFPIKLLYLMGQAGTTTTPSTAASWLVDIAAGAAASEVDLIPNLYMRMIISQGGPIPMLQGPFPVDIPTGTRLSVRGQASTVADANSNKFCASLLGLG